MEHEEIHHGSHNYREQTGAKTTFCYSCAQIAYHVQFAGLTLHNKPIPTTSYVALSGRVLGCRLQEKIEEAEAARQRHEENRDALKAKINSLTSTELKVHSEHCSQ